MDKRELTFDALKVLPPWEWPAHAAETLIGILQDPKRPTADRITAAELAGELPTKEDEISLALLNVVAGESQPAELRARAAISLGPVLEETDSEGFDEVYSEPPITRETFDQIKQTLRKVYSDQKAPKEVRRRALEASVRAHEDWHTDAIRAAAFSVDEDWKLTAAFCMRWVRGFDQQILMMIESKNPLIHREAVMAAGSWELDAAWPHVAALVESPKTEKQLLLAAIAAAGSIRPTEAHDVLDHLADSRDTEIAEAVEEALMMADLGDEDEDDDEEVDEDDEEES